MLVYGRLARTAVIPLITTASTAPGYLGEAEIIQRYTERSDRDLSALGFYIALASFKLAGILEGVHYRYANGQTVGAGFAGIGDVVEPLFDTGLQAIEEYH